jgi:hypothetical protein
MYYRVAITIKFDIDLSELANHVKFRAPKTFLMWCVFFETRGITA